MWLFGWLAINCAPATDVSWYYSKKEDIPDILVEE